MKICEPLEIVKKLAPFKVLANLHNDIYMSI